MEGGFDFWAEMVPGQWRDGIGGGIFGIFGRTRAEPGENFAKKFGIRAGIRREKTSRAAAQFFRCGGPTTLWRELKILSVRDHVSKCERRCAIEGERGKNMNFFHVHIIWIFMSTFD